MQNQFNSALQNNSLFKNTNITTLTLEDLNPKIITLEEGEVLFRTTDFADSIFLVIEGEMNVLRKRSFLKTTTTIISPNEFFGHEEFFNQSNRNSTAVAVQDSKLAELSRENLDILLQQYDNIFNNLKDSLSDMDSEIIENLQKLFEERSKSNAKKVSIFFKPIIKSCDFFLFLFYQIIILADFLI
jgi:CRP-like cAMP-binding protein